MKKIITRIGYFRTQKNLSARELSLRIGKHDTYINTLESKDFNLPVNALLEIIDALGITCEEFFANDFSNFQKNKAVSEMNNWLERNINKPFDEAHTHTYFIFVCPKFSRYACAFFR
ncbi:MAG: helix-turn-helix domain-containing protein [Christensenellaceae bacterium]|nr:helix-turn-helix domain-containing protein [Christensenellaceae bacterium]